VSTQPGARIPVAVAPGALGCYAFWRCGAISRTLFPSSFSAFPTGAHMKLSISYKHVESHRPVEAEVERHVSKLGKLLRSYAPDLVQLHGAFSKTPRTDENSCSLNLSMPTGTLHATGTGATVRASCKKAFSELEAQVKKHQAKLRKDYEWRRKRPLPRVEAVS
jgi:ribosome-associated translation inhibitor RaiA